jgi:hypothetical protein
MAKRPEKPPVTALRPGEWLRPSITMQQERLIGRFCVAWTKLETSLDDFIWGLLEFPIELGRVITKGSQVERKIQILRDVGPIKRPIETFEILEETLKKIEYLKEDRNSVFHGSWWMKIPDLEPFAFSLRPKGSKPFDIIGETFPANRMHALIHAAESLSAEMANHIKYLEKKPPEEPPPTDPLP